MDMELTKLYYSISEVAELFGVNQSLLRYWQSEFPKLHPKTNKKGDRKYTQKDIEYIERIYQLVKVKGYTLEGARKDLNSRKVKGEKLATLLDRMEGIKKKLSRLEKELE